MPRRSRLLEALAAKEPRVEDVALAIAADAYPGLDADHYRAELDAFAEPIAARVRRATSLRARIAILNRRLFGELEFRGNEENYYDPRNSYLNEVIDRRLGIPITLAALMIAVGRRAGVVVEGIGFPGHFLVRFGGTRGPYADPFHGGNLLTKNDLNQLVHKIAQASDEIGPRRTDRRDRAAFLKPIEPRRIAMRMLTNLQQIYEKSGDHAHALLVCDRLVDLGGEPHHRRDRGLHAFVLGAARAAAADFSAYLASAPDADDAGDIRELLDRVGRDERASLH